MCGFFANWKKKKDNPPAPKKTEPPKASIAPKELIKMGRKYETGVGLPKDAKKAFDCYCTASEKGDALGTYHLGRMYIQGLGVTKDCVRGLNLLAKAADAGCKEAQIFLGDAYRDGCLAERNLPLSFQYLKKAADNGDLESIYRVGMMYKAGEGTAKNPREAHKYLSRADRLGHPLAHEAIFGKNYLPVTPKPEPKPVKKTDPAPKPSPPASDDFRTALSKAKDGHSDAMYRVGMMYLEGKGTNRDCFEAVKWLRKSADMNCTDAFVALGDIHNSTAYGMYAPAAAMEKYAQAAIGGRDEYLVKAIDIYRQRPYERDKMLRLLADYERAGHHNLYAELAHVFVKAEGVDPDSAAIANWAKKASAKGIRLDYEWIEEAVRIHKGETRGSKNDPVRHYRWKYRVNAPGGYIKKQASYDLRIRYKDYLRYTKSTADRWPSSPDGRKVFVTPKDPYVREIAGFINELTKGLTPMERANCALKFVQSFRYTSDQDQFGVGDYTMYPLEMLWTQTGDCEDYAILFVSIMKAMGFDMALIRVKDPADGSGHMMAGICHRDAKGTSVTDGKKTYVYCEATSTTNGDPNGNLKMIGEIDPRYRLRLIIPIP